MAGWCLVRGGTGSSFVLDACCGATVCPSLRQPAAAARQHGRQGNKQAGGSGCRTAAQRIRYPQAATQGATDIPAPARGLDRSSNRPCCSSDGQKRARPGVYSRPAVASPSSAPPPRRPKPQIPPPLLAPPPRPQPQIPAPLLAAPRRSPQPDPAEMGRALDNGLVRNNLFTQWVAKAGSAAKACGNASAKEKGEAPGKGNGEADAGKGSGESAGKRNVELAVDYFSPGFIIPGLWSPAVARLNKFYDDINQSLVFLKLKLPTEKELNVNQLSYLLSGSMSINDLSDRVRFKVNLDICCPLKFSIDGNVLADDSCMTSIFKNYASEDGCTYLNCDSSEDPVFYQWTLVEKKKKRAKSKSASRSVHVKKLETFAVSDQQTEEVIEFSVPYAKWLNWKKKFNRKKSQYVKRKRMH